jgi:hypothetical protein
VIRVEDSVEINKLLEEVVSYTSNPENFPVWAATVAEVRQEEALGRGPLREGERSRGIPARAGRPPHDALASIPAVGVRERSRCRQSLERHEGDVVLLFPAVADEARELV